MPDKWIETIKRHMDSLWLFVFLSITFKCFVLTGIVIEKNHFSINFGSTISLVWKYIPIYLSFVGVLLSFALLLPGKLRLVYLLSAEIVSTAILLIDTWYFRGFGSLTSLNTIKQSRNIDSKMFESILSVIYKVDLLYLSGFIIFLILAFLLRKDYCKKAGSLPGFIAVFAVFAVIVALVPFKFSFLQKRYVDSNLVCIKISPAGYHFFDLYSFYKDSRPVNLSSEENGEIENWFIQKQEYLPDNGYKGRFSGKNLIHIDVESLESFVINRSIDGQEITPNLNRLFKNSIYFSNIYEQVNQGNSSDADLLVNTSVYPIRKGSTFFEFPKNSYNSLPKILEREGYFTIALHPDEGTFWNWMESLTHIGFQKCVGLEQWIVDEEFFLGITDGSYLRQLEAYMVREKFRQPFYAFLPTQSSHSPFDIPEQYREMQLGDGIKDTTLGLYFQSMHYADKCIGEYINALDRDGLLDNTVVVICGDHAGITKYHPEDAEKVKPSQDWWLVKERKIPFMVYSKDGKAEQIDTIGGQVDILPTVAYLMGIGEETYNRTAMGRNLVKTNKNFAVLSNGEVVGEFENQKEKEHAIKGLEIGDIIIKSNYFKNYVPDDDEK